MSYNEKKIKFLATKLASLQAELKVSREIMVQASKDVDAMFTKKYFPEIPVEPEEKSDETGLDDYDEEQEKEEEADQEDHERKDSDPNERAQNENTMNESANKNADPEVKKLFKKIASMTHPDKLSKLSDYERKRKEQLFKNAMIALENNDLIMMADIAMDLEIETPDLTKERLKETEKKIIAIKDELNHIESTFVWKWFFCEDEAEKESILQTLFGIMYANTNGPRS